MNEDRENGRRELLRLSLRFLACVFLFEMAVSHHYGLAPKLLYYLLIAGDPPVVAGVAIACYAAGGTTRKLLALALVAFAVVAFVAFADFVGARGIPALKPIGSRAGWNIAAFANIAGFYGVTLAARLLPQKPLHAQIGRIAIVLLGLMTFGFVFTRWIVNVPPLVPFFNGCLFLVPASYLFVVTESGWETAQANQRA